MVVDKYIYLSKAGAPTVEVWDKRSERMVDFIDCAQIIRYTHKEIFVTYYQDCVALICVLPDPQVPLTAVSHVAVLLPT